MANKLLKHFGFSGSKKVSSSQQSPSHEYSAKTSSSVHENLHSSRTTTKTRSSTNVIPRGSSSSAGAGSHVRPDPDGRRHSDASAVRGSLAGARSAAARSRAVGGGGWTTLSRDDDDSAGQTTGRQTESATIASSSVRGRRPPRVDSLTHCDDMRRSRDHADPTCPVRLHVTSSVSSDNLTVRLPMAGRVTLITASDYRRLSHYRPLLGCHF